MTELEKYKKAFELACHDRWGCPKDEEITKECEGKGIPYIKQVDCDSCWRNYFLQQAEQSEIKPMTNRQWLETLSDEKFAKEMISFYACETCSFFDFCDSGCSCPEQIVRWLKAAHKESEQ